MPIPRVVEFQPFKFRAAGVRLRLPGSFLPFCAAELPQAGLPGVEPRRTTGACRPAVKYGYEAPPRGKVRVVLAGEERRRGAHSSLKQPVIVASGTGSSARPAWGGRGTRRGRPPGHEGLGPSR